MKDSGIEWIGQIPENWNRTTLLNLLRCNIADGPHETPNLVSDGIPFISVDSLNDSENIDLSVVKKYISEDDYNEYMKKANLENGDILFSKAATIGKTAILKDEKIMVWSPLAIIKVDEDMCSNKYLYHMLSCKSLIKYVSLLGGYNTQINVGMRALEKAFVPVPPKHEQHEIAKFLDDKVGEIDVIISKTKASIEEYKKYKNAVIAETITKGLDKTVSMKESGIEWVGKIPSHWEIHTLSQVFMQLKNKNSDLSETNLLSLSYGKIKRKDINSSDGLLPESFDGYNIIDKNDIVLRLTDLQNDHKSLRVGHVKERGIITSAYVTLRCKEDIATDYYYYFLHTFDIFKGFYGMGAGVRQGLNYEGIRSMKILSPDIKEQQEIVEYLNVKCAEIDALIAKKEAFVEEMEAYKKSLIYEYVTGKKEVL